MADPVNDLDEPILLTRPMNLHDPAQTKPWLTPLSFALKKLIANDVGFAQRVRELNGKTILLHIDGLDIHLYAIFQGNGITLSHELPVYIDNPDVSLRGRINDFIALAKQQRDGQSIGAGQVEIQGDLHTAQTVQNLFKEIDIDFEEIIARSTSDSFAYAVGSLVRRTVSNIRRGVLAIEQDVGEYVQYEKRLTPTACELTEFAQAVDELAIEVERLESRIRNFSRSVSSRAE